MFTTSPTVARDYARLEAIRTHKRHVVVPTFKHNPDDSKTYGFTVVLHTKAFARQEYLKARAGEKAILARMKKGASK